MEVLSPLWTAMAERGRALRSGLPASAAPQRPDLPWRSIALQAGGMWLASRIAYVLLTYFGLLISQGGRTRSAYMPPSALLAAWSQWDANWYISIGLNGYPTREPTGFFPLYPVLIHLATLIMGRANALAAAMVVANLGTLGAFIALGLLASGEEARADAAWRVIRVFAAYPLAVFLAAPYTEGLFVALAASALLCARRGSWRWAAGWALLAALTRPTGLALAPALLWEYGRQHEWWTRATWQHDGWRTALRPKAVVEAVMVVGAAPLSIVAFATYNWVRFGDPITFLRAQRIYWQHQRLPLWETFGRAISQIAHAQAWTGAQAYLLENLVPLLIFLVLAVVGIRTLPFAFTLYTFGVLYLSLASPVVSPQLDILTSVGRYMISVVPIFLLLGKWTKDRPWLDMLIVSGGFLLQAVFALAFLRNGYVL
jgi:hypothetical protein